MILIAAMSKTQGNGIVCLPGNYKYTPKGISYSSRLQWDVEKVNSLDSDFKTC